MSGIYDVLNCFGLLAGSGPAIPQRPPFKMEIVGAQAGRLILARATGLTPGAYRKWFQVPGFAQAAK